MTAQTPFYITTPIYYVNDKPHIGHAYTSLACDVMARFMRLDGRDVMFLTGTDEHGQKVDKSARDRGIEPLAYADKVSENFRQLAKDMNFTNDDFIRTTESRHKEACQALWQRLIDRDEIYLGAYEGWYSVRDEAFYGEEELKEGPNGEKLAPTGAPVEWVAEPSYFFRLSAWGDKLLEFYEANPDFIAPKSRRNEVISFVKQGLRDLSVSRTSFSWGVPVPGDEDHVMYVWLDALTNYLTAVGYPDETAEEYGRYWPANVHVVGKDILRFHALYWPAFLLAADLPVPHRVYAHGWWTNEGEKISKSLGNVIDPYELVETYGLDPVRYFLLREVPFGNDGDFSRKAMVQRMNGDLANDIGNLSQRVLSMIFKNCEAQFPKPGVHTDADRALLDQAYGLLPKVRQSMETQQLHTALADIWAVISEGNRYVDEQAPWGLKKTDPARMGTVLHTLAEVMRVVAILVQPIMPQAMDKMLTQLQVPSDQRDFTKLTADYALMGGVAISKPEGVFPRYVEPEEGTA